MNKKLLELNGVAKQVRGQEIDRAIRNKGISKSNELAILRKQLMAICNHLGIEPTQEFKAYYDTVEEIKKGV
jgi:hypothetical protein